MSSWRWRPGCHAVALDDLATVGGDELVVDGESDGGGKRNSGVEVDTCWKGRSLVHV